MIKYYANKTIQEVLEDNYSKSHIKRLIKQKSIKHGELLNKVFVYSGQDIFVICKHGEDNDEWKPARQAEIFWEYHYQLVPKVIKFKKYDN